MDDKDCCTKVRDKQQDIYELLYDISHKLGSLSKILIIVFLAGTAFGMSDSKWMPYASMIWEFGKDIFFKGQ